MHDSPKWIGRSFSFSSFSSSSLLLLLLCCSSSSSSSFAFYFYLAVLKNSKLDDLWYTLQDDLHSITTELKQNEKPLEFWPLNGKAMYVKGCLYQMCRPKGDVTNSKRTYSVNRVHSQVKFCTNKTVNVWLNVLHIRVTVLEFNFYWIGIVTNYSKIYKRTKK